ncbi:hypothetical protein [Streptomyces sp. NPDC017529]
MAQGPGVPKEVNGYPLLDAETVAEPQDDAGDDEANGDDGGAR